MPKHNLNKHWLSTIKLMTDENNNSEKNNEFDREQFDATVKEALQQARKIGEAYRKYFESKESDQPSIFADIESRLNSVIQKYNELFGAQPDGGASKLFELNKQIEEIKKYHQELITDEHSISSDIKESQDKITDFYVYLFGGEDSPNGKEPEIRKAIEDVLSFQNNLNGDPKNPGYKKIIEDAHEKITELYSDIFDTSDDQEKSKADTLHAQIESVGAYHGKLEDEIKPFIKDTRIQIEEDKKAVKALLGSAIGPSLLDGFLESKREYKQIPKYYKSEDFKQMDWLTKGGANVSAWIWSKFIALLNYAFFIVPLLASVIIFSVSPEKLSEVLTFGASNGFFSKFLNELEVTSRILITLPLWWIAWFGHRNLSQNKRMAEEYNHKAQVTRMYIKFTSDDESKKYPLSNKHREQLYDELIEVIARHPGQVFGRDETLLDKVLRVVAAWKGVDIDKDEDDTKNSTAQP